MPLRSDDHTRIVSCASDFRSLESFGEWGRAITSKLLQWDYFSDNHPPFGERKNFLRVDHKPHTELNHCLGNLDTLVA